MPNGPSGGGSPRGPTNARPDPELGGREQPPPRRRAGIPNAVVSIDVPSDVEAILAASMRCGPRKCSCAYCVQADAAGHGMIIHDVTKRTGRTIDLGDWGVLQITAPGMTLSDLTIRATVSAERLEAAAPDTLACVVCVAARDVSFERVSFVLDVPDGCTGKVLSTVTTTRGADLTMRQCSLRVHGSSSPAIDLLMGVMVQDGSKALLEDCVAAGYGASYVCGGVGTELTARSCRARQDGGAAFTAVYGGTLNATACTSQGANYGFYAADRGKLKAGAGCRALECRSAGFVATSEGIASVSDGCVAEAEAEAEAEASIAHSSVGFFADGGVIMAGNSCKARGFDIGFQASRRSALRAGAGCLAIGGRKADNVGGAPLGAIGFASTTDALMKLGDGCVAYAFIVGFDSRTAARLVAGEGCAATMCFFGFHASLGGSLSVGPRARGDCIHVGFLCTGVGSQLEAGNEALAPTCALAGFLAAEQGAILVGPGSVAQGCGIGGVVTLGGTVTAPRCVAQECKVGFLAMDDGRIKAGPGCKATANRAESVGFGVAHGTIHREPLPEDAAARRACRVCKGGPQPGRSKLFMCVGCKAVRYCGAACAAEHWAAHRQQCAPMGAARSKWLESQAVVELPEDDACVIRRGLADVMLDVQIAKPAPGMTQGSALNRPQSR